MEIDNIKDITIDDFIKISDKDKKGKFSYIGKVISIHLETKWFVMETFYGTMGFKVSKDSNNELSKDEKPVGWDKFQKDPEKFRHELHNKEKLKDVAPVVKTQKELVMDLVKANKNLSKVKLFKLLKDKIKAPNEDALRNQMELALLKIN